MPDWRSLVADRCGGANFDAPGTGYAFSAVLADERELERANIPGQPETALLKLSVADPTWKMPLVAMLEAFGYYMICSDATRYTDNAGIREGNGTDLGDTHKEIVRALVAQHSGLPAGFGPDWVQYSPHGIKGLLAETVPTALFQKDRGDLLVFPVPGYAVINSSMNRRGIEVQEIPLILTERGWRIPLGGVRVGEGRQVYVYFNNPGHNPTGFAYTREELLALVGWATVNQVKLIVDEAYIRLAYNGAPVSILDIPGWEKCALVLQSASKGWSATGLRFAWVVADPVVIAALRKVMDVKDSGLFGPTIAAGLTCLHNPQWAEETRERYRALHQILAQGLKEAGFGGGMPDAGLCQFTRAPRSANGQEFGSLVECVQWFRQVLRISLMHFGVGDQWYLRWAVTLKPVPECGLPTEEAVLAEVARRLQEVRFTF